MRDFRAQISSFLDCPGFDCFRGVLAGICSGVDDRRAGIGPERARKKPGLKPGFPVLLTAGDVIISSLIDPRSIIVVAGVGVISVVRGIAVAWAIA